MQASNLEQAPHSWRIVQITDTHLMQQPELEFAGMNPEQSFHAVMQHIQLHYPQVDAIVHSGDLAQQPAVATYQRYLDYMQSLHVPFYQVPGNHDDLDLFPFHDSKEEPGLVHLGNWCLILLNSAVSGRVDGHISAAQLARLEELLEQHRQQHIIVVCHHHPFALQSHWIDQHKLKNTAALTEVLAAQQQVKAVIYGHVHQDSVQYWQQIQFLSTPSTCVQFKPGSDEFALDQQAPGYRILELHPNGQFTTQVHRLKDFHHRIETQISGY